MNLEPEEENIKRKNKQVFNNLLKTDLTCFIFMRRCLFLKKPKNICSKSRLNVRLGSGKFVDNVDKF